MIRTLLGLLARTVEQLGRAQTQALGGLPGGTVCAPPEGQGSVLFEPKRWVEPHVHHRSKETWRTHGWSCAAAGQTLCGWGRQRTRENFALVPLTSWAGLVAEQGGRGFEGQAALWVLQRLYELVLEADPWHLSSEFFAPSAHDVSLQTMGFLGCLQKVHDELRETLRNKHQWRGMGVALASVFVAHGQAHLVRVGPVPLFRWRRGELDVFAPGSVPLPVSSEAAAKNAAIEGAEDSQPEGYIPLGQGESSALHGPSVSLFGEDVSPLFSRSESALVSRSNALGWGEGEVMVGSVELLPGDVFVMASQGFCDIVPLTVLRDVLSHTSEPIAKRCQRLIDIAYNTRFRHDDMTLALCEVVPSEPPASSDSWQRWQGELEEHLFGEGT
ncbi:MAG: hypothetical protein EP343_30620 [Deltaproteobacteria bacterium]|nr:MAG: hypothetical protein EP343_30620 [Deltaproteobacteria bacterium]